MELLDLPPEIFQRIIQKHVGRVGLCKAWKQREVCKTFNTFITEEVFGRQPMKVYSRASSKQLFRNGLDIFFEYRVAAPYDAHDFMLSVVRKAVNGIMNITQEDSNDIRANYIKEIAIAIKEYCRDIKGLIMDQGKRATRLSAKDSDDALLLCLVAGMGNAKLAHKVLKHCPALWKSTYCFGLPIEVAVRAKDLDMVKLFLQDPQSSDKSKTSSLFTPVVSQQMKSYYQDIPQDFLKELLSLYVAILGRPPGVYCGLWFADAVISQKIVLVEEILDMGFTPALAKTYRTKCMVSSAGLRFRNDLMKLLLERKIFSTRKSYTILFDRSISTKEDMLEESILNYAVRNRDQGLATVALEAGAEPDGIFTSRALDREYPIRTAVVNDVFDDPMMVELLLEYGADPEGGDDFYNERIIDSIPRRSLMHRVIKKAIKTKHATKKANKKGNKTTRSIK
ncbi:hypothetical protein N0V90_000076 [Kalmusia sp. IMI 367209]|nr:hypothetical protein N0V90_000076 [Kalmusia sp. IMI 367209]